MLSGAGFALIAAAVVAFKNVPYPGVYALAPTLGAFFIIVSADADTTVGRLLSTRFLVGLGLISYGAYLWHLPLFAFTRRVTPHEPAILVYIILCVAALLLAWLSWVLIERPFRNRNVVGRRTVFASAAVGIVAFITLGAAGIRTSGFEVAYTGDRLGPKEAELYAILRPHIGGNLYNDMADNGDCIFWSRSPDPRFEARFANCTTRYGKAVVVLGDLHAMSVFNSLARARFSAFQVGISQGNCRPHDPLPFCHYESFARFLARNRDNIGFVLYHQSGSYLIRDYKNKLDSSEAFEFGRRYTFDYGNIDKIADYLDRLSI